MSEANVNLTIHVHNKTVEQIMPFLEWALAQKLEAIVTFGEGEEDPKVPSSYQTMIQKAKDVYQQRNLDLSSQTYNLPQSECDLDPHSGTDKLFEEIPITGDNQTRVMNGSTDG